MLAKGWHSTAIGLAVAVCSLCACERPDTPKVGDHPPSVTTVFVAVEFDSPLPTGHDINALAITPTGLAVTSLSAGFFYQDGGVWRRYSSGQHADSRWLDATGTPLGFVAGGEDGVVLERYNGTWWPITLNPANDVITVFGADTSVYFGDAGGFLHQRDRGVGLTTYQPIQISTEPITGIALRQGQEVLVDAAGNAFLDTGVFGPDPIDTVSVGGSFNDVASDNMTVVAVGANGLVVRDLFGPSPTVDNFAATDFNAVSVVNANSILVAGDANVGGEALWYFDGSTWSPVDITPGPEELTDVFAAASDDFWLSGSAGFLAHYAPAPQAGVVELATQSDLTSVWFSPDNGAGFACGDDGEILRWADTTWVSDDQGPFQFNSVFAVQPSNVFAAADGGVLFRFNGSSWNAELTLTGEALRDVWGPFDSSVYIVGGDTTGLVLHFNGLSYQVESLPAGTPPLYGVSGTGDDNVYAVGAEGTILHRTQGQWTRMAISANDNVIDVAAGATATFAIDETGGFYWRGTGAWQRVQLPAAATSVAVIDDGIGVAVTRGNLYRFDPSERLKLLEIETGVSETWLGAWASSDHIYLVGANGRIARLAQSLIN